MVKVMEIGYNVVEFEDGDSVEIADGVLYVNKGYDVVAVFAKGQWSYAQVVETEEEGPVDEEMAGNAKPDLWESLAAFERAFSKRGDK